MPDAVRFSVTLLLALASTLPAGAQGPAEDDRPKPLVPLQPQTRQEEQERQALKLYAFGLLCEHEDRLLEAQRAFEEAVRLNPKAAPPYKALIPIYLALDRSADALAATRKALDLDPADYETWYLYARQLRAGGKTGEAADALRRGVQCKGAADRPDLCLQMYQDLGQLYESGKDYKQAAWALGEALKVLDHPDALQDAAELGPEELRGRTAETLEHLGRVWLQAHRPDQAVAAFRKAQAQSPEAANRLALNLAQVYRDQGKPAEALDQLDRYLRLLPQAPEPYEMKVALLTKLGRQDEVVPWLEKATTADRHNVGLKLLLAREHATAGQPDRAERIYLDLGEHNPSPAVYRGLFRLYQEAAQLVPGRALALLDGTLEKSRKQDKAANDPAPAQARAMLAALQDDPDLSRGLLREAAARLDAAPDLQQQTLHLLAVLAVRAKQLPEAERLYRRALATVTPQTEALVYGGLLRVLEKAHKYEEVVRLCRAGLKKAQATNLVLFHSEMARALAQLGKADEAVAAADEAVALAGGPDRLTLRHHRVRVLTQVGRYAQAEAECRALLKELSEPGEVVETRYLLSHVYSAAGNYSGAEEQLQWILKHDASHASACNDLGYLWADRGKALEEAEKLIRKALELDREQRRAVPGKSADPGPDHAAFVDSLGWVLFRRGRLEEARRELERAAALPEGDDPVVWDHLGDVCFRQGQVDRARSAWRQALRLYEQEYRRDRDQRYQDLRRKVQILEHETP